MRSPVKERTLSVYKVMLALVAIVASHSGLSAQDSASDRAFFPPVDVRLEVAAPALLVRNDTSAIPAREGDTEAATRAGLTRSLETRRPFLSRSGALIGAGIGCVVGAVVYYDTEMPEFSQTLAWSAGMCALLAIPGATLGAILIQ